MQNIQNTDSLETDRELRGQGTERDYDEDSSLSAKKDVKFIEIQNKASFICKNLNQNCSYDVFKKVGFYPVINPEIRSQRDFAKLCAQYQENGKTLTVEDIYKKNKQNEGSQTKAIQLIMEPPEERKETSGMIPGKINAAIEKIDVLKLAEDDQTEVLLELDQSKNSGEQGQFMTIQFELFKLMTANIGAYLQEVNRDTLQALDIKNSKESIKADNKIGVIELVAIQDKTYAIITFIKKNEGVGATVLDSYNDINSSICNNGSYETWIRVYQMDIRQLDSSLQDVPVMDEEWKKELNQTKAISDCFDVNFGHLDLLLNKEFFISKSYVDHNFLHNQENPKNGSKSRKVSYKIQDTRIFFFQIMQHDDDDMAEGDETLTKEYQKPVRQKSNRRLQKWDFILSQIDLKTGELTDIAAYEYAYEPRFIPVKVLFIEPHVDMVSEEAANVESVSNSVVFICLQNKEHDQESDAAGYLHMVELKHGRVPIMCEDGHEMRKLQPGEESKNGKHIQNVTCDECHDGKQGFDPNDLIDWKNEGFYNCSKCNYNLCVKCGQAQESGKTGDYFQPLLNYMELPVYFPVMGVQAQEFDSIDEIDMAQTDRFEIASKNQFIVLYDIDADHTDEKYCQFIMIHVPMEHHRMGRDPEVIIRTDFEKVPDYVELYQFLEQVGFNQTRTAVYDRIKSHQINYPIKRNQAESEFLNSINLIVNQDLLSDERFLNTSTLLNTFNDTLTIVAYSQEQDIENIKLLQMKLNRFITSYGDQDHTEDLTKYQSKVKRQEPACSLSHTLNLKVKQIDTEFGFNSVPQTFLVHRGISQCVKSNFNIEINRVRKKKTNVEIETNNGSIQTSYNRKATMIKIPNQKLMYTFIQQSTQKQHIVTENFTEIRAEKIDFMSFDNPKDQSVKAISDNPNIFTRKVIDFIFKDEIKREYCKPQNVTEFDDDRKEIVCIFFNYEDHFSDIVLAVIGEGDDGRQIVIKDFLPCFHKIQLESCVDFNDKQNYLNLTFSSEISQGKMVENNLDVYYFFQNYQVGILDLKNNIIHIEEKQVRWIPKTTRSEKDFQIQLFQLGVKTIVMESFSRKSGVELQDFRLFPYYEFTRSFKGGEYINQVCGTQVVLKIYCHLHNHFIGLDAFAPIRDDDVMNDFLRKQTTFQRDKRNIKHLNQSHHSNLYSDDSANHSHTYQIIPITLRDLKQSEKQTTFNNKLTKTRVMELNQGLNAIVAETWINEKFFQYCLTEQIFSTRKISKIMDTVNRRGLNSKLLDLDEFMKSADNCKILTNFNSINKITPENFPRISNLDFFQSDPRKIFLCHQVRNGASLIDFIKDTRSVEQVFSFIREHDNQRSLGYKLIKQETNPYQLTTLERILQGDVNSDRFNNLVNQHIVIDKDVIQYNMDYLSPIVLKLSTMQKKSADLMLKYFQENMPVSQLKIDHFESILSYAIEMEWKTPRVDEFFKNPDEVTDGNQLRISSMIFDQNKLERHHLSEYVNNELKMVKVHKPLQEEDDILREMEKNFGNGKLNEEEEDSGCCFCCGCFSKATKKLESLNESENEALANSSNNFIQYVHSPFRQYRDALLLIKIQLNYKFLTEKMLSKEKQEHMNNDFDLSKMIYSILSMSSTGEVSRYTMIIDVANTQFKKTFSFLIFNALVYIGLFTVPVIVLIFNSGVEIQTLQDVTDKIRVPLIITAIGGQCYTFFFEILQMYQSGFCGYYSEFSNWLDSLNFFLFVAFCAYVYTHQIDYNLQYLPHVNGISDHPHYSVKNTDPMTMHMVGKEYVPQDPNNKTLTEISRYQINFTMIITFLMATTFIRLTKYMVLFKEMGELVELLIASLKKLILIIIFSGFVMANFTLIYSVIGVHFDENTDSDSFDHDHSDYAYINQFLSIAFQTYRNFLGDISVPHYFFWERIYVQQTSLAQPAMMIIIFIWFIWGLQLFMSIIVILNFLIAIVTDSYMEQTQMQMQTIYLQRAEQNKEFNQVMSVINSVTPRLASFFEYEPDPFNTLLIASKRPSDKDVEKSYDQLKIQLMEEIKNQTSVMKEHIEETVENNNAKVYKEIEQLYRSLEDKFFSAGDNQNRLSNLRTNKRAMRESSRVGRKSNVSISIQVESDD